MAEIAPNLQLPPGLHAKAVERSEAVGKYIERPGSPLFGRVSCFYPQGSMRSDATISTRGTDDEYDIDIVAEIFGGDARPEALLDDLYAALADYPVQRVVRQTRCVTVYYADGMRLDVTPARRTAAKDKESVIAHAKGGAEPGIYVPMNADAFGQWYTGRKPTEETFAAVEPPIHGSCFWRDPRVCCWRKATVSYDIGLALGAEQRARAVDLTMHQARSLTKTG